MIAGAVLASSATVVASSVPSIEGHVTDPGKSLSASEKEGLEETLGAIQNDLKEDVAAYVADVPAGDLARTGREAFDVWHIGRDWENGVLITVRPDGSAMEIVQALERPALKDAEARSIAELAIAGGGHRAVAGEIREAAAQVESKLRVGAKQPTVRPWGSRDGKAALWYAVCAALVALVAFARASGWRGARRRTKGR